MNLFSDPFVPCYFCYIGSTAGSLISRKDSPEMKMDTTNPYMGTNMR